MLQMVPGEHVLEKKKEKNVSQLDIIYDHLLHIYVLLT